MNTSKPASVLAIAVVMASGCLLLLASCGPHRPTAVTFDPPYPERNARGDPIRAVYEGRIPCAMAQCQKLKVQLVLYETPQEHTPSTYWLGIVGTRGNERVVTRGAYTMRRGVDTYPEALVYELDAQTASDLRYFWRVNADILLLLDEHGRPKVGNAAWGYMLSRYTAPYGPRTYIMQ